MGRGPVAIARLTVNAAHEKWRAGYLMTQRVESGQRDVTARYLAHVAPIIGHVLLDKLTGEQVRGVRLRMEKDCLGVYHALGDLRCFLAWAVESGYLIRSPFPKRVMPRNEERPPDRLTDEEVNAILGIEEPWAFYLRFLIGTGLRWSEACLAQRSHVEGDVLLVVAPKTGKLRRIPLVNPVAGTSLLPEVLGRVGRLMPYEPSSHGSLARTVRLASRVERFHAHQCRHTFGCRWLERGGSLETLQPVMGHASIVTTQRYARLADKHVRAEAMRLAGQGAR
jgi:integrase